MSNVLICKEIYKKSQKKDNETNSSYHLRIKEEFVYNVCHNKYFFRGKSIRFKNYLNSYGEIECFYHVITEDRNGMRHLSIKRYESCLLIFLILNDSYCDKVACQCITIKPNKKYKRIMIYCSQFNYLIILEEKESRYNFVTAYPVSMHNVKKYL